MLFIHFSAEESFQRSVLVRLQSAGETKVYLSLSLVGAFPTLDVSSPNLLNNNSMARKQHPEVSEVYLEVMLVSLKRSDVRYITTSWKW